MKKQKKTFTRLASLLFALVLITTSIIGGTFAKYTTSAEASDTARVAKFGVVVNAGGSLFSNAYLEAKNGDTPVVWTSGYVNDSKKINVATSANTGDNIVAPGTKSATTGLTFGVTGTPEVATQVTATIKARDIFIKSGYTYGVMVKTTAVTEENFEKLVKTGLYAKSTTNGKEYTQVLTGTYSTYKTGYYFYELQNVIAVSADYYPVVYSLAGSTTTSGTAITASSTLAVANALKNSIVTKSGVDDFTAVYDLNTNTTNFKDGMMVYEIKANTADVYAPNTNLGTAGPKLSGETLTWVWNFENSKDLEDTILGDLIAQSERTTDYCVVAFKTGESGAKYADVTIDNDYVYLNSDASTKKTPIASLKTEFNIEINVTQVEDISNDVNAVGFTSTQTVTPSP